MANVSLEHLEQALNTVDFPAGKEAIIDHAVQQRATADVQQALRSLPPVEYRSAQEVIRSVDADVGAARVESIDADPEKKADTPGVADRLR